MLRCSLRPPCQTGRGPPDTGWGEVDATSEQPAGVAPAHRGSEHSADQSGRPGERRDNGQERNGRNRRRRRGRRRGPGKRVPSYGALDLGTNNCRLLVARPSYDGFRVVDAFSRIVRLGEGASRTGRLSDDAMNRSIDALKVCASKLKWRNVNRSRLIATEACRITDNGAEFIKRVADETGMELEIIDRETEARLALAGSSALIEPGAKHTLVFDIGGGSTELMWTKSNGNNHELVEWMSLPAGVVTVAEGYGGVHVSYETFEAMKAFTRPRLKEFAERIAHSTGKDVRPDHLLGTSGTVTTIAGIHLGLPRYDRNRVDGCWLKREEARDVTRELIDMSYEDRAASPCIGKERADLVLAGCAILEAITELWPAPRIRVADRGLREGILTTLMREDGVYPPTQREHARRDGN